MVGRPDVRRWSDDRNEWHGAPPPGLRSDTARAYRDRKVQQAHGAQCTRRLVVGPRVNRSPLLNMRLRPVEMHGVGDRRQRNRALQREHREGGGAAKPIARPWFGGRGQMHVRRESTLLIHETPAIGPPSRRRTPPAHSDGDCRSLDPCRPSDHTLASTLSFHQPEPKRPPKLRQMHNLTQPRQLNMFIGYAVV